MSKECCEIQPVKKITTKNLKGSWAVVTGASSGIGAEFAKLLAQDQINLILVARRADRLAALGKELKEKYGIEYEVLQHDLSLPDESKKVFNEAVQNKNIQILINNAGIGNLGSFTQSTLENQMQMVNINISSLTELTYYFTNHMLHHRMPSYVINVASIASYAAIPTFSVYCATKSFVKSFSLSLHHELANTNISVTAVAPGGTATDFMERGGQVVHKNAHKTMMSPETVARIGLKAAFNRKSVVVTGGLNQLITTLSKIIPENCFTKLGGYVYRLAVSEKK
ncbi:MAG: SDR family oxidoreductase [Bacteriovoracaceae bacterium]